MSVTLLMDRAHPSHGVVIAFAVPMVGFVQRSGDLCIYFSLNILQRETHLPHCRVHRVDDLARRHRRFLRDTQAGMQMDDQTHMTHVRSVQTNTDMRAIMHLHRERRLTYPSRCR